MWLIILKIVGVIILLLIVSMIFLLYIAKKSNQKHDEIMEQKYQSWKEETIIDKF